jgi:hypothetical protein
MAGSADNHDLATAPIKSALLIAPIVPLRRSMIFICQSHSWRRCNLQQDMEPDNSIAGETRILTRYAKGFRLD